MRRDWQIYGLKDPRTDQIKYVGITHDLKKRFKDHHSQHLSTPKGLWIAELRNEGLKPLCVVLEQGADSWMEAEKKWIAHYRSLGCDLTNRTLGGQGKLGAKHSPETIKKMAQPRSAEGRANIAAGIKRRDANPATKLKQREHALTLRDVSRTTKPLETRQKISASLRGKPKSAEHRANLAASQRAWLDADPSRREHLRLKPRAKRGEL